MTDSEKHTGVAVFVEQHDGRVTDVTLQLLGKACDLAAERAAPVYALLPGRNTHDAASALAAYGADKVFAADARELAEYATLPYTRALTALITEARPEIVLFGATSVGRDLAPRVAQRLNTGLTADCTELTMDSDTGVLNQTKPAFNGRAMVTIATPVRRPQMATVRPGVMREREPDPSRAGEIVDVTVDFTADDLAARLLQSAKSTVARATLDQAGTIVAGGRGVGSRAGFAALRELAEVLGAELGASRPAVESGWIGEEHMIGQTGKTVRPDLYIACGISGALQHCTGLSAAKVVVAINRDRSAPIFSVANYGLVGDLHEIVPLLTRELRRR